MQKRAVIVHLDAIAHVTPLVGGYLKAFAHADDDVRAGWRIDLSSHPCRTKASLVLRDLVDARPDLVAFSVYTWNAGAVKRLLPALRGLLPRTRFVLGGVEVVDVAPRYVHPTWEDTVVCNGEGERTFRDLLRELLEPQPDLARVGGITFPRDGEWITTPGQPRIQDLTELPSPWLTGVFDGLDGLEVALLETNRGCPFACEFCFWGGAIGQKVYQQDLERLKEEITWIGKRGIRALSIADANFGIFPRDVELAEHIVATRKRHGGPVRIVFNSSKVRPDRVEEISRTFADAGLLARHVFSLQSLSPRVLELAKRTGLAREPYRDIQHRLNAQRVASIVELVWPMPGETLDSYRDGVDELLRTGAQGFLIYPLVWLNSTGYSDHTDEYGVVTLPDDDPASGARIVVRTREVEFAEYLEGLRFLLAVFLLHDCRGLYATMQLLDALGVARFRDVLTAFARHMETDATGPVADAWRTCMANFEDLAKYVWRGALADRALHATRLDFDRVVLDFAERQTAWYTGEHGALLRAAVDYDLLTRPYAFVETKCELGVELRHLEVTERRPRVVEVLSPHDFPRLIDGLRMGRAPTPDDLAPGRHALRIDYRAMQLMLGKDRTPEALHWLLTHAVQEMARLEPKCTTRTAVAEPLEAG